MCDQRYNGWTKRATWLVNVWFSPGTKDDVALYREILEEQLAEWARGRSRNSVLGCLIDMIDLDKVNWEELAKSLPQEEEEET